MPDPQQKLLDAIDASRSEMVEFTQALVSIPSENPPGNYYSLCAEAIVRKLRELGLDPQVRESPASKRGGEPGYSIAADHGEGERVLYFHGHYDVVPHSTEGQFHPVIEKGNLFGRGSSDMKGGLACMIFAVHALRCAGTPLKGRIRLRIVPDEETGGERGSGWLSRLADFAPGGIGMLTAEPTSGAVWNANRGAISLRIVVKGKPAHVGLSCQGVNAFERMLAIASELEKLKLEIERRETAFPIRPLAARRSILMMGGECRGGSNFNVVPESCSFTVDRRINPEEDLETEKRRMLDLLDRLRRDGIEHEVEILQEGCASGVAEDQPLPVALARAVESVTGKRPEFEMCPGLLENRFYAQHGVPALAYGPGLLSVSHGPNEFVPIENLRDCAAVYALAAEAMLGRESRVGIRRGDAEGRR